MFQQKRRLRQDDSEYFYLYAQTMNGMTRSGLVAGAYVPDHSERCYRETRVDSS